MLPSAVPSKVLSSLSNISGANISLLPEIFQNIEDKKDFLELLNTLQDNYTKDQFRGSCLSCIKFRVLKYMDNKNPRRPGKSMLVSYNIFHAKCIPQSHTHMVSVLNALVNRDNLGLSHYSKL